MILGILDEMFDVGFIKCACPWFIAYVCITACWGVIKQIRDADIERKGKRWSLIIMLDVVFCVLILIAAVVKRMMVG